MVMAYGIGPEINHFIVQITVSVKTLLLFCIRKEIFTSPCCSSSILSNSFFSQFRNCETDVNFSRDGQRIGPMRVPAKVDHTYPTSSFPFFRDSTRILLSTVWPLSHALVQLILRVSFSVPFRSAHVSLLTYLLYDPFVSFQYADGIRVVSIVRAQTQGIVFLFLLFSLPSVFSFNQID